jgi:hypothetical protein
MRPPAHDSGEKADAIPIGGRLKHPAQFGFGPDTRHPEQRTERARAVEHIGLDRGGSLSGQLAPPSEDRWIVRTSWPAGAANANWPWAAGV